MLDLSSDRPPCGSLHPFGSGRSFHPLSPPLQQGICFFRNPLPARAWEFLRIPLSHPRTGGGGRFTGYDVEFPKFCRLIGELIGAELGDTLSGLPRSVQVTEPRGFHLFAEGCVRQRFPTKQGENQPCPILGLAFETHKPVKLDDDYRWFVFLTLQVQPSAYSDELSPRSRRSLTGPTHPCGWLHCQSAWHLSLRRRTAPRLPTAERRVELRCCCVGGARYPRQGRRDSRPRPKPGRFDPDLREKPHSTITCAAFAVPLRRVHFTDKRLLLPLAV